MLENKNYLVKLEGLPGSDSIVFKLICSVSKRTKGRDKSYELVANNEMSLADLVIKFGHDMSDQGMAGKLYRIELNRKETAQIKDEYKTFTRPLIASRVLEALDQFVEKYSESLSDEIPDARAEHDSSSEIVDEDLITVSATEDTLSFELTEQEASELAIVHDESLTNPSNIDDSSLEDTRTAQITPFRIMDSKASTKDGLVSEEVITKSEKDVTPKALVVDDSPSVRKQLELELELFDVDADYAATASEAFDMLGMEKYDVAFLDVVLPDKDGFSICRHIKEISKDTAVIMLTGKAKQADKVKGALAGCDAYMVKPVGRMTFQNVVKNYLRLNDTSSFAEA